jgi:hypothetical protein
MEQKYKSKENQKLPLVSIIIVNLNGEKWLRNCLVSVLDSNYPNFEVIIVDNGSTDKSLEIINKFFSNNSKIKIIKNEKNLGWSPANNIGASRAKGEILIFLSNDMEVDPNWILEIVKVINSNDKVGIVQCMSLSIWDRKTLDSAMNYLDRFGYAYGYTPTKKLKEVFFAEGMAFAAPRKVYQEIGGLDDYFFMEYDDMDLGWRSRLAGRENFFVPTAVVYHVRGGTIGPTYYDRINNVETYTRNHLVTLIKNYGTKNLLLNLPVVILLEVGKVFYLAIRGKGRVALAALSGLFSILRDAKIILGKRKIVQTKVRKVSDKEILKYMVPFNPKFLFKFLGTQAKGERPVINSSPPIFNIKKFKPQCRMEK